MSAETLLARLREEIERDRHERIARLLQRPTN